MYDLTHASFFSGVGGLDLGLERAGWRTVSFSEIDPYASAVLAERWPGVPNLGDITAIAGAEGQGGRGSTGVVGPSASTKDASGREQPSDGANWRNATLWTGGFPCQDLSVAGKRRGMGTEDDRTRSGLAYAFLELVERHRPPAILLENVPGLLSSNAGRDFGALLDQMGNLGYWWAYRILDAQFFGVPQRRRRVFICALHAGAGFGPDSPAAVLSVGARCGGHSQESDQEGQGVAAGAARSPDDPGFFNATARFGEWEEGDTAGNLSARDYKSANHLISPPPDSGGVREADGLAGRVDDREVVGTLVAPDTRHSIKDGKRQDGSRRDRIPVTLAPTLRVGPARPQDGGPGDTVPIIAATLNSGGNDGGFRTEPGEHLTTGGGVMDSDLLPLGLDSHRYRCCGNGVVSNVSEWIGHRLAAAVQQ